MTTLQRIRHFVTCRLSLRQALSPDKRCSCRGVTRRLAILAVAAVAIWVAAAGLWIALLRWCAR